MDSVHLDAVWYFLLEVLTNFYKLPTALTSVPCPAAFGAPRRPLLMTQPALYIVLKDSKASGLWILNHLKREVLANPATKEPPSWITDTTNGPVQVREEEEY
jgi:hypothetical protein